MDKKELEAYLGTLGIEYAAVFVPQSASRNSAEKTPSLNWRVAVSRKHPNPMNGGTVVLATDYMQGIGHVPDCRPDNMLPRTNDWKEWRREQEKAAHTGEYPVRMGTFPVHKPLPAPALADVLYCLLLDGDAADETFEDWCANYGYDSDSRKAEATYNACRDTGRQLQRMFTRDELAALREAFQDY